MPTTEHTILPDLMEEHTIESSGYDKSVDYCPYYEIAADLLAALEQTADAITKWLLGSTDLYRDGQLAIAEETARASIAKAKGEA